MSREDEVQPERSTDWLFVLELFACWGTWLAMPLLALGAIALAVWGPR